MPAGGESERGILGEQALVWRKAAKRQPLMGMVQRQLELPAAPAVCRARGLGREPQTDLPEQLAPRQAEGIATADPHERFDGGSFELGRRAADDGTVTKFLPKAGDEIVRAAAAHRATQRLGLAGRESRECLADLQHLILIQNDTERFGEALAEQGVVHGWVVRLAGRMRAALCFAPAHVRVHRAADDRPRPHDGDLDGEIFEVAWPATPDHLDLRATLDLEQADRVAGADAIVNRGVLEIDA